MNLIQTLEKEAVEAFAASKEIPEFRAGDTLRIGVRVVEGERVRTQNLKVCALHGPIAAWAPTSP